MDRDEYDDILRSLVSIAAHQEVINERLAAAIERLGTTRPALRRC